MIKKEQDLVKKRASLYKQRADDKANQNSYIFEKEGKSI
jgi:hypothetical protein